MTALRTPAADARPPAFRPARGDRTRTGTGIAAGAAGMICVGGSVAVSSVLSGQPVLTAEAIRYALACALLVVLARLSGRRVLRPRGREWIWLSGIAVAGLVVFNIALVQGSRHAEPAVLGVAVACVPAVLAVAGPLLEGARPRVLAVAAGLVVTAGAALVQGVGRSDAAGLLWAVVVFCCEAAFTLMAVPVLGRHGPWGVSVHSTWIAAALFGVFGLVREGPGAALRLGRADWLTIGYLAVAVTAVAFVLWYSCVGLLGPSRAGLLTGVAPAAAAITGVLLGGPAPRPLVWAGMAVVGGGLAVGLRASARGAGSASTGKIPPAALSIADASVRDHHEEPAGSRPRRRETT
jgi:drug/metabolite transporter (DMT)-like permease